MELGVRHLVTRNYGDVFAVAVCDQIADRENDGECNEAFEYWIVEHHDFSHGWLARATASASQRESSAPLHGVIWF